MARFLTRCTHCILPMARALDILACTAYLSVLYPFGPADRPTGRQLISGYVGKAAFNGVPWGIWWARWIDWAAMKVGDGPDHCYRAYVFWKQLEIPQELDIIGITTGWPTSE